MEHPTIWKFVDSLKKVQAARDVFYEHLVAGNEPPKKKRKYRLVDDRLLRLIEN